VNSSTSVAGQFPFAFPLCAFAPSPFRSFAWVTAGPTGRCFGERWQCGRFAECPD
jgi:hypothetical protein